MSGWIVPVKDGIKYPLNSNTFYITTESVTNINSSDKVDFFLEADSGYFTTIRWRFSDWGYVIYYCTPTNYSLKFPVTPPTDVNKTWEITFTTEDVKIKCNSLQVLHFIFNKTHDGNCTSKIKGKIATRIRFLSTDTATKMFSADQFGK